MTTAVCIKLPVTILPSIFKQNKTRLSSFSARRSTNLGTISSYKKNWILSNLLLQCQLIAEAMWTSSSLFSNCFYLRTLHKVRIPSLIWANLGAGFPLHKFAIAHKHLLRMNYWGVFSTIRTSRCTIPYVRSSSRLLLLSPPMFAIAQIACSTTVLYFEVRKSTTTGMTPLSTRHWHCSEVPDAILVMHQAASTMKQGF